MKLILGRGTHCKREVNESLQKWEKFRHLGPNYYGPPSLDSATFWVQGEDYLDFVDWVTEQTIKFDQVLICMPEFEVPPSNLLRSTTSYLVGLAEFAEWLELLRIIKAAQDVEFTTITLMFDSEDDINTKLAILCEDTLMSFVLGIEYPKGIENG